MLLRNFLFILLLLSGCICHTQDLNGIWRGKLTQAPGGCFPEYTIELQVNFIPTANTLSGKAYDYHDTSRYVKLDFIGRYNSTTKRMVIIENTLLETHIPINCIPCIKTYDLSWSKSGNEEILTGECKGREFGSSNNCPPYKIVLKRAAKSDFAVDVEQSPELLELQKKLVLKPRSKELVKTFSIPTSEIRLDFYDNAEIDNDTITVLMNGKLLLYRKMLTARPLTIMLNAFPNADYELVMYADNLGTIPPNTALLVITAGIKKYEVRLASSEEKSATVKFRYEEPVKSP
ncbi:MAG TPA: hypothetical protein VK645_08815 [Chitinophagaceae bacterium]|nr:hypothetical protein [Chitinophagaceae bacterium]